MACLVVVDVKFRLLQNKSSEDSAWEKYLDDWRQLHIRNSDDALVEDPVIDDAANEVSQKRNGKQLKNPKYGKINLLDEVNKWYLNNPLYNSDDYLDLARLLETFKEQFINLDVEGNGYLETKEFETIMRRKIRASNAEVKKMVGKLDKEGRGRITYSDFLHNMLEGEKSVLQNTLKFAFLRR